MMVTARWKEKAMPNSSRKEGSGRTATSDLRSLAFKMRRGALFTLSPCSKCS